jgi:hypothetical protein
MIDLHSALVLTHVVAMLGLFSTLTIEGLAVRFLRRAITYEQAREWAQLWALLPVLGAPSILLSLASGIYLATILGTWSAHWAAVAVPTMVIVAIAGGVTAPGRNRVRAAIATNSGPLPKAVQAEIRRPVYSISFITRTALLSGLVVDMVIKPDGAVGMMSVFGLLGLVCGARRWRRE